MVRWPTSEPSPLAACASCSGASEAIARVSATRAALAVAVNLLLSMTVSPEPERSIGPLRSGEHVRFELVVPSIEIEIAAAPLDLAAL